MNKPNNQVKRIYEAALRVKPGRRDAYLDRICGDTSPIRSRVNRLLNAHEKMGDFLAEPTRARPTELPPGVEEYFEEEEEEQQQPDPCASNGEARSGETRGTMIGRYKLLQKIGEGGFGDVYMAAQTEPVKRKVALKIIKLGMDTDQVIARFEAERQALALMDHPNIARIFDGGATENGRPYFVMELVRGVPITEYCNTARLNTRERLGLFRQVCHAVQHAHTKGIIHRDIKPSNVMVTLHDGVPVPKVIDFGIAKAVDRTLTDKTLFTQFQQMIGTPEYMSPEQAEMSGLDIDTRADVYSLGVLLYELLTGSKPFDMQRLLKKGYEELLRTIREEDPPRPSTRISTLGQRAIGLLARGHDTSPRQLGVLLRGDLDWIVMRALEKDRQRRYETAIALADDVQRHLDDQPVLASPPTAMYRVRKYVRRHRAGVLAATLVVIAMVTGTMAATWGLLEANDQRGFAQKSLESEREARVKESNQRKRAVASERAATHERDEKEVARAALEKALRRANGTRLSALSQATLPRDPALALLLAIEGATLETNAYANRALLDALEQSPRREILLPATGGSASVYAWSPDETQVASGVSTGGLAVWDSRTGKQMHRLEETPGMLTWIRWRDADVLACFFSIDDQSQPRSALISWNLSTGSVRTLVQNEKGWFISEPRSLCDTLPVIEAATNSVLLLSLKTGDVTGRFPDLGPLELSGWPQLSADRQRFVTLPFAGNTCRLHDAKTGEIVAEWPSGRGTHPPTFSPDSKLVVTYDGGPGVGIRSTVDGSLLCTLTDTVDSSNFAFIDEGRGVLSKQGAIKRWSSSTGELLRDLELISTTRSGQVSPNGKTFIGRDDVTDSIKFLRVSSGEELLRIPSRRQVGSAASDWRFVAFDSRNAHIVDPQPAGKELLIRARAKPCAFAVHPDGRHVVDISTWSTWEPRVWDLKDRNSVRFLPAHQMFMNGTIFTMAFDAAFSPDGNVLATAGGLGEVILWNGVSGAPRKRILIRESNLSAGVTSVEFSPDGRLLVLMGSMSQARVHDSKTGRELFRIGDGPPRDEDNPVLNLVLGGGRGSAFSPDGRQLLLRFLGGSPQVFDRSSKRKLFDISIGAERNVNGAAYSPDGRWIGVSHNRPPNVSDGTCEIFEAATGRRIHKFRGINSGGTQFPSGFGPRSNRFLTCVGGQGVVVHDIVTGKSLTTLRTPGEPAVRACFSPNGRWILGVSFDSFEVYVWDATSGQLQHHLTDGSVHTILHNASFTTDSESIIMLTERGIRVLPIDLRAAAIRVRPRDLQPEERTTYEIDSPPPHVRPQAWQRTNEIAAVTAYEQRLDDADRSLRNLLGEHYDEDRLGFHDLARQIGDRRDIGWALGRVARKLSTEFGHFDEAATVYRYAIRETLQTYGEQDSRVMTTLTELTQLLGLLGRGGEIGPYLKILDRHREANPKGVELAHGSFLLATGKSKAALEAFRSLPAGSTSQQQAEAYMDLGDYERAETLLKGTLHRWQAAPPGLYYLSLRRGVRRAIRLYTHLDDAEKLAAWREIEKNIESVRPKPLPGRASSGAITK